MENVQSTQFHKQFLLNNSIDLIRMEKELTVLIKQEEKYRRENDAKLRAVAQNVPTYKDFQDIVKASHLKPLEKQDKTELQAGKIWNTMTTNRGIEELAPRQKLRSRCFVGSHSLESEQMKLERALWNMDSAEERYKYLKSVKKETLLIFVSSDLCSSCMGLLFTSLDEMGKNSSDFQLVVELLEQLTKAAHFSSSLLLLNKEDKSACRHIFHLLESMADVDTNNAKVYSLRQAFRIIL